MTLLKTVCALIMAAGIGTAIAGSATVNYNSTGSSPFRTTTDGSSNNLSNMTIWDASSGANGLSITVGGAAFITPTNGSIFVTSPTNGSIFVTTPTTGVQLVTTTSPQVITPTTAIFAFTPTNAIFAITGTAGYTQIITGTVNIGNVNPNGPAASTASSPTVMATDQARLTVTTAGGLASLQQDPCMGTLKTIVDFRSQVNGGVVISGVSSKKNYICSMSVMVATATTPVSLIEGTGAACAGGTSDAIWGAASTDTSTTGGTNFAANGGYTHGDGQGMLAVNTTANQNVCVQFSTVGTPTVAVHLGYVQQ